MILCGVCDNWQHGVCFGVLKQKEAPEFHVCVDCSKVIVASQKRLNQLMPICEVLNPDTIFIFIFRVNIVANARILLWLTLAPLLFRYCSEKCNQNLFFKILSHLPLTLLCSLPYSSNTEFRRGIPYEREGDARCLAQGYKLQIFVSVRVFRKEH